MSSAAARRTFPLLALAVVLASVEAGSRGLEALLVRRLGEVADQFATARNPAAVFEKVARGGVERYERTAHHWIPEGQSFAAQKPPGGFRAFVVGASAAMGWPHGGEHSIAGLLQAKLARLYPGRPVEILNTAGNTYASFRVKVVLEEVVGYDPDLVVIYTGNNEFLENLVYHPLAGATELPPLLARSAFARLSRRVIQHALVRPVEIDVTNYGERDMRANRLSFAFGRASHLREDPAQLQAVREHYRQNVASMIRTCRARGVTPLVLRVPVNLKDWAPNVSTHGAGLSPGALAAWQEAFAEGYLSLEAGDASSAVAPLEEAVRLDDDHAESWFRLGRALLLAGRGGEVKAAFERALMRDAYPFRSIFDDVLAEVCRQESATLVDTIAALEATTADGILGLDALVDYVHPTVASNEIIADRVLEAAMERGLLPSADLARARLSIGTEVEEDPLVLRALYGQYLVMRQYDHLPGLAARLRRSIDRAIAEGGNPRRLGRVLADLEETEAVVGPYAKLLRAEKLGRLSAELSGEQAEAIFQRYVDLVRRRESGDMTDQEFRNFVPRMDGGAALGSAAPRTPEKRVLAGS